MFALFILCYSCVHVHFEYRFWGTPDQDIFGKYAAANGQVDPLMIAKQVYYTKATWMIALVWLQCLGASFPAAIAYSFFLYSAELLYFFPLRAYSVLNLLLAIGCVIEQWVVYFERKNTPATAP